MAREYSPLHPRMRRPALVSLVVGFGLGLLAVYAQRLDGGQTPLILAVPFGGLAAVTLYAVMYRNLSRME